jgi:hypothetical protein
LLLETLLVRTVSAGFLLNDPYFVGPNRVLIDYGNTQDANLRTRAAISAQLGLRSASSDQYDALLRDPADVIGVILNEQILYADEDIGGANVRVALQVHDSSFNTRTTASRVHLVVSIDGRSIGSATCQPDAVSGACVATFFIDKQYFQRFDVEVQLSIGLSSQDLAFLGTVTLHEYRPPTVRDDVLLIMPNRELFRDESFTVDVVAQVGHAPSSYTLRFDTGSGLRISQITARSIWSAQVVISNSGQSAGISALLADPSSAPVGLQSSEVLCTVTVAVNDDAALDQYAELHAWVQDITDVKGQKWLSPRGTPGPASFLNSDGFSDKGQVYVSRENHMGLLPYAEQTEFVNTAMLTGTAVIAPVTVLSALSSGRLVAVSRNLQCSSPASIVTVSSDCQRLRLIGFESSGAERAAVAFNMQNSGLPDALMYVRVWIPGEVTLQASDQELNAIEGFFDRSSSCRQVFQQARLHATATFSYPSSGPSSFSAVVTHLIAPALTISNTNIVSLSSIYVRGLRAGSATVSLTVFSNTWASIDFDVSNTPVQPLSIIAGAVQSLVFSSLTNPIEQVSAHQTVLQIRSNLTIEQQRAAIVTGVHLNDDTIHPLAETDGLEYRLSGNGIVGSSGSEVIAISNGVEDVTVQWRGGVCNNVLLATGTARVFVVLPAPDAAYFVGLDTTLTFPRDPAAQLTENALPKETSFQVQLGFGSRRQGMTNDVRTVIDLSGSNNLFTVEHDRTSSSFKLRPNTENRVGSGTLLVRFTHTRVTVSRVITIVRTEDIAQAAFHHPYFPGSESSPISVLYQIANISRYQQASLKTYLLISDQSSIDVSMEPSLLTLAKRADRSDHDDNTLKLSDLQLIPAIVSPRRPAEIHLCAELFSFAGSECLRIDVVRTSVTVLSVVDFTVDGQLNVDTVRGAPGSAHFLDFSLVFSDNSRVSQVMNFGEPLYPGLMRISTSEPNCLPINSATGVMILSNNCEVLVSFGATPIMGNRGYTAVWANMDATVGDIDLGDLNGPQFPTSVQVGSFFRMGVRMNTGTSEVAAIDVTVNYDEHTFEVLDVVSGTDWASGSFLSTINDPPGRVSFGGTPQPVSGEFVEFAIIYFKVKVPFTGKQYFTGTVNTVATLDQRAIGPATPRPIIAGVGYVPSGHERSRRTLPLNADIFGLAGEMGYNDTALVHERTRRSACTSAPCSSCSQARETGDANGDCVFDVNDVTFTQLYVLSVLLDNTPTLLSFQSRAMDPDLNDQINTADAYFLLRVNFRLLRFITEVTAVVDSSCALKVQLKALTKGDIPAPTSQTYVFVDLESPNTNLYDLMQQARITVGSAVNVQKNSGFNGGIWEMAGPSSDTGVYQLTAEAFHAGLVTLSLIQATTDVHGVSSDARTGPMLGSLSRPYAFPHSLSITLPLSFTSVNVIASNGYTGLLALPTRCSAISTSARPSTQPTTTGRATTSVRPTTQASTTSPGTTPRTTTGRVPTTQVQTTTTRTPFRDRCFGSTTLNTLTNCSCGTMCHECDLEDSFPTTCYTCKNGNYLLNGLCVIQCPVGFRSVGTGNFFRRCEATVTTTAAPTTTTTTIAIPPQFGNSTCVGKTIANSTVPCDCASNCHSCMLQDGRHHVCLLCKNAAYLLDGACVAKCPDSYISTGTGLFSRTCVLPATVRPTQGTNTTSSQEFCNQRVSNVTGQPCSCSTNCHQCSLVDDMESECFVCKNRFFLHNSVCVPTCPAGFVGTGTGNFFRRCVATFTTAAPPPGTGPRPPVDVCMGRKMTVSNHTCRCQSNCYQCEFGGGVPGACQECKNGHFRHNGQCVQSCPLGTRPRGIGLFFRHCAPTFVPGAIEDTCVGRRTNLTNATCSCEPDCHQCAFQGTAGVCSMCKNNQYLFDGNCVTGCPDGYSTSGMGRFGRFCRLIVTRLPPTLPPGVTTRPPFGNASFMDVCAGDWTTQSHRSCSCPSQCYQCPIRSRQLDNQCEVCKNSFLLHQGVCVPSCPAGFSAQGTGRFFRRCIPAVTRTCSQGVLDGSTEQCRCQTGCNACTFVNGVASGCTECADSLFLHDATCVSSCPDGSVATGTGSTGRTCTSIARRSVAGESVEAVSEPVHCDGRKRSDNGEECMCDDNCHECELHADGQTTCVLCSNAQYLFKGECHETCPDGLVSHGQGHFGRYCTRHGQNTRRKILAVADADGLLDDESEETVDESENGDRDLAAVIFNTFAPLVALSILAVAALIAVRKAKFVRPTSPATTTMPLVAESS